MGEQRGSFLVAALTAALALALNGCGDGGPVAQPRTLGAPTASGSTVNSASPAASPTTAKEQVRRDVEAAVRAYYAAMEHAVQTGDTVAFESATDRGCSCRRFLESVHAVFEVGSTRGANFVLGAVTINSIVADVATADVDYESDGYAVLRSDGSTKREVPPRRASDNIALVRVRGSWLVTSVVDRLR